MYVWKAKGPAAGNMMLVLLASVFMHAAVAQDPGPLVPLLSAETAADACVPALSPVTIENTASQPAGVSLLRPSPRGVKRLFGVIPNYRSEEHQDHYHPLTTREKFDIARRDSFDWPNYFLLAGYAVQSQVASGGFSHNGGFVGFGEFYARAAADQIIGAYVTEAMLPSLFHEDPRYFRSTGPFWHRVYHAASSILITRGDDGRRRFFVSEVAGNAAVVAITSFYYPASQSASEGFERFSQQLGNDVISNLLTEFWPDIKRHLPFHK